MTTQNQQTYRLEADYGTSESAAFSTDQMFLRMLGEAHHKAAKIKPDLALIDPDGNTVATMDAWAVCWVEVN